MTVTSTLFALLLSSVPSIWAESTKQPTIPPIPTIPPAVIPPVTPSSAFNNLIDHIGVCKTQCPSSLLCIGYNCWAPQPICNGCGNGKFCDNPLNTTIIGAYNNAALNGKITVTVSNGQAVVHVNTEFQAQSAFNFTDIISHLHEGGRVDGKCRSLQPVCNATSCGHQEVCAPFDGCKRCDACGNVDLTPLLNGNGFDPSTIVSSWNITRGQGEGAAIGQGVLATIQAGWNRFSNITFGDDTDDLKPRNGSCVATLVQNAIAQVDRVRSNMQDAALQIAIGAQLAARDISVLANTTLQFILAGDGARCSANRSIALDGSLVIRGSATADDVSRGISGGRFDFPGDSGNNTIGINAIANVGGGVGLTGDLGRLKVSVGASGATAGSCHVPKNATLRSSTDILGDGAEVIVRGALNFTGHFHQPKLSIPDGGNVTIDVGRNGNFTSGHLNLTRGGHVEIRSNGNNTFFSNLTCEAGASIRIRIDSIAKIRNSSIVLFTYSTLSVDVRANFHCNVELYDGQVVLPLNNPNNVAAGRRLLADTGSVTWTDNGATAQDLSTPDSSTTYAPTSSTPTDAGTTSPPTTTGTPTTPAKGNSASLTTPVGIITLAIIMIASLL